MKSRKAVARWFSSENKGSEPVLDATGETVGVVALHAAILEPTLFSKVVLSKPPRSGIDVFAKRGRGFFSEVFARK